MFSYTVLLVLITVYYHRIAVLCFSYHIIYFIHFLCVYFSFSFMFMPANTLEVDTGEKLYVPEGTITVRDSDFYLYDPNGASISINCMLQQLYPYRHAYLSNYSVLSRQSFLLCFLNNLSGIRKRYLIYMNNYCYHVYS